jgi:hypothetical protein
MSEAENQRDQVKREFNQQNYAAFCRQAAPPTAPPHPHSWDEWEQNGWWRVPESWPAAEAFFQLENIDDEVNHRLRCLRSPLVSGHQTLQHFLLYRLWKAKTTTVARVSALGDLVNDTAGVASLPALHDRALLVFRNHWRMLEMGDLAEVAAEVYLDLCDLQPKLAPDGPAFPKMLEGLDIDHLEKCWRLGAESWKQFRKECERASP